MISTRVGIQIRDALLGSTSVNQDTDLMLKVKVFEAYKVQLNALTTALYAQYSAMTKMNQSRLMVAECISDLAQQSPLSELSGIKPTKQETQDSNESTSVNDDIYAESRSSVITFCSIHRSVFERRMSFEKSFRTDVLDYVLEWERVIVNRISKCLEKAEQLRVEVDHYQEKMNSLTSRHHFWLSLIVGDSSDEADPSEQERLDRNKIKYEEARNAYTQYAQDLRLYIEEVTERGWKDLFPVLMTLSRLEISLASDENKLLSDLVDITSSMSSLAQRYGLEPESRVKDLETKDVKDLSTRTLEFKGVEPSSSVSSVLHGR